MRPGTAWNDEVTGASHRRVPGRASGVRLAVKITNPAPSSATSVVGACERAELGHNLHTAHIAVIAWGHSPEVNSLLAGR